MFSFSMLVEAVSRFVCCALPQRLPPLTPTQAFLLGALSKALATVATYPYIRSKVRGRKDLVSRMTHGRFLPLCTNG